MSIERSAEHTVTLHQAQMGQRSLRIKTWASVKGEKVGPYRTLRWAEFYMLRPLRKEA